MKERLIKVVRWVRDFIRDKFNSKNEDLPYYITILVCVLLFIVGLNSFVELTDELAENELKGFDEKVSAFIISFRRDWLTHYFIFTTHLGDRYAYVAFTILMAAFYLMKHKSWRFIIQITSVLILASLSNIVLKRVINRTRPSLEHLVSVNTLSYPSGHSMSAMAFFGFLIFLSLRYTMPQWLRITFIIFLMMLILTIGISRIYLGVHYPSDVLAGFIGGLIWVAFCAVLFSLIDLLRKRRKV